MAEGRVTIGDRRERLAFQQATPTPDGQGGRASSWATLRTLWGAVRPQGGSETLQANKVTSRVGYLVTVAQQQLEAAAVAIGLVTRANSTATVTTSAAHGLVTGQYIRLLNAGPYTGRYPVTVLTSTTFTIAVAGSPLATFALSGVARAGATRAGYRLASATHIGVTPIASTLRIVWTPSWDANQAPKTLEILAVRPMGRDRFELDCAEVA